VQKRDNAVEGETSNISPVLRYWIYCRVYCYVKYIVKSSVLLRCGGSCGGIFMDVELDNEDGLPYLPNLPTPAEWDYYNKLVEEEEQKRKGEVHDKISG